MLASVARDQRCSHQLLRASLARVAVLGERFELGLERPPVPTPGASLLPLQQVVADPDLLGGLVGDACERLGTDEPRVAASILYQGTIGRIAAGVLAATVTERRAPLVELDQLEVGFLEGRCAAVALGYPEVAALRGDPAASRNHAASSAEELFGLVTGALDRELITPLHDAVRAVAGNSPLQLRGNAVAAVAGTLTRLQRDGAPTAAADLVLITRALPALFTGTGHLEWLATPARPWCFHARRTCCQMYRVPDAEPCGTCPLRASSDRQLRWQQTVSAHLRAEATHMRVGLR